MIQIDALSTEELYELKGALEVEIARRHILATAADRVADINRETLNAEGVAEGDPWRQPAGAHDAYPEGWTVTHNGKTWVSTVAGNVWEPGVSGWREHTAEGAPPAEWARPSGAHDAYDTGDLVTFEGAVYRSRIDGNVWSPAEHPEGWEAVDGG